MMPEPAAPDNTATEKRRQAWIIGLGIVLAWAFGFAWATILQVGCTA